MREILFRGKKYNKSVFDETDWIYGSLIDSGNHEQVAIYPWVNGARTMSVRQLVSLRMEAVDPDTIGQYTGLQDKNGVKIFEGDILDYPRWVVTYLANTSDGLGMNAGWYIQRDNFESWIELSNTPDHVVLGNIHDNPELLEVTP